MYRRFRIALHRSLDKPFTVDYGFIFGTIIYVLLSVFEPPEPFLTTLRIIFFMLMFRTTWNRAFGFPYDEEEKTE